MPDQTLDQKFNDILKLYEYADELIDTVDQSPLMFEIVGNINVTVHCKEAQYELVSELIDDLTQAADVLTESFTDIAENGSRAKRSNKMKVEGALRRIFAAIDAYKSRANKLAPKLKSDILERTGGIVDRVKDGVGHIVAIFVQHVDISIERIMHKAEIEELRRKEVDVAFHLHQISKSH